MPGSTMSLPGWTVLGIYTPVDVVTFTCQHSSPGVNTVEPDRGERPCTPWWRFLLLNMINNKNLPHSRPPYTYPHCQHGIHPGTAHCDFGIRCICSLRDISKWDNITFYIYSIQIILPVAGITTYLIIQSEVFYTSLQLLQSLYSIPRALTSIACNNYSLICPIGCNKVQQCSFLKFNKIPLSFKLYITFEL